MADRLRELLNHWSYETSAKELVALGPDALARILDSLEGKGSLATTHDELEGREYDSAVYAAVAAFALADADAVLDAMQARGWKNDLIARTGIVRVRNARVLPIVVEAFENADPTTRQMLIDALVTQGATDALTRALKDRSSSVRSAAAEALKKKKKKR